MAKAQFRANNDFIHIERGVVIPFDPGNLDGGKTAYLEITGGVTIKPPLPKPTASRLLRPEFRYDVR